MTPEKNEQQRLQELTLENQRLLTENNLLLKKLHRASVLSLWFRIIWVTILIGAPLVLYYFVFEPWFTAFGSSFETFEQGWREIPGWKQFFNSGDGGE